MYVCSIITWNSRRIICKFSGIAPKCTRNDSGVKIGTWVEAKRLAFSVCRRTGWPCRQIGHMVLNIIIIIIIIIIICKIVDLKERRGMPVLDQHHRGRNANSRPSAA